MIEKRKQILTRKQKDRKNKLSRERRANRTEEEKEEYRKKDNERNRKSRANRTEERREELKEYYRQWYITKRDSRTPKEKEEEKKRAREKAQGYRDNWTLEERVKYNKKKREGCKERRANRTEEEIEEDRVKELERINKNPERRWTTDTLRSHRRRGYAVLATVDEIYKKALATKKCRYCGVGLKFIHGLGFRIDAPSLDRINNGKVITKDNSQIICKCCNALKGARTHKEFIDYCGKVYKNSLKREG